MEPTLAAYVGASVTIRYDPRDLAEIRVFHPIPSPKLANVHGLL